jgi:hypothetical protein
MTKRLILLGLGLSIPYAYALSLGDLRQHTVAFEGAFFAAFAVYALAVWLAVRAKQPSTAGQVALVFAVGILLRAILIFSQPRLSDDMYRYIWDGRVQASGINPYLYPPEARELANLRDAHIWPLINRKSAVTVYPAGAELAFAAIWRLWPDNPRGFQAVMTAADLLAGVFLVRLLRLLGRDPLAVLIYLWSPLVIFETAHSAHVDGLVLPLLAAAWLARVKERQGLTGLFLGLATALKLYPLLLLPVLWKLRDDQDRLRPVWSTPLAFLAGFLLPYTLYLSAGSRVIGYLPHYFIESFNPGLAYFIGQWAKQAGWRPELAVSLLLGAALAAIYAAILLRPGMGGETALRACIWPIGAFTLLTQNLFPWYLLWLVPLLAIFLPPRAWQAPPRLAGIPLNSWTGWWLFCGLVALAYTFFIHWKPVPWVGGLEYLPLYAFLLADLARRGWKHRDRLPGLFSNWGAPRASRVK